MSPVVPESLEQFCPFVGEQFELQLEDGSACQAALLEAKALPAPAFKGRQPFTLLFEGPSQPQLAQRIYRLSHPRLNAMEMFLVPVGRTETAMHYEAVFN
jgi:hypothetical protein